MYMIYLGDIFEKILKNVTFLFLLLSVFCDIQVETNKMEREEFEILTKNIRRKLLAVSRNFPLPSEMEADDVVQEALVALWELVEQDYPVRDAEALAVKITKNICVSHYRKAHLEVQSLSHDNYMGGMEATVLTDKEDLKKIRKSIYEALTMTQREYLHLRNDEGKTLDEIAEITGKPKTSIKSTLSSARKQMFNLIKSQL